MRHTVSREIVSTGSGVEVTLVRLSEEAVVGLRTGLKAFPVFNENTYWFRARTGDFVRLPTGETGVVCSTTGSNLLRIVSVQLDKPRRRWFGLIPSVKVIRFVDDQINQLELIATQEELAAIE